MWHNIRIVLVNYLQRRKFAAIVKEKFYNLNLNKIYQYDFHDPFIKIYENRGNLIMGFTWIWVLKYLTDRGENYLKSYMTSSYFYL